MRRTITLLAGAALLVGCGTLRKTFNLNDTTPAHTLPRSTSVYGDWVLGTPPDSTAFAGASLVEMTLQPGTFTITATYPAHGPVRVSGTSQLTETGTLTLTPSEVGEGTNNRGALVMSRGVPLTLLASAAGNTLVFAPPSSDDPVPSSVWHKKSAAEAAGKVTKP